MGQLPSWLRSKHAVLTLAGALWLGAVAVGMKWILDYQVEPGVPANAPVLWPDSSTVVRARGLPTLLLVAHPRCPCTRATLSELALLMAHTRGRLAVRMLLVVPEGVSSSWARTDLWCRARSIPAVEVLFDANGLEARRFGVSTSGQTLLYDSGGHLVFAGGITPGRGHEGDNAGREAIERRVAREPTELAATPVFGCALSAPAGSEPGKDSKRCPK